MIEIKNLNKKFNDKVIFNNLNLTIEDGEMLAISGASGSGKTTLLNILGKLDKEYDGNIIIDNKNLKTITQTNYLRNTIGYLFQNYALADNLTVTRSHCAVPKVASQTNAINYCVSGYSAKERLQYYINNGSLKSPDNKTITRGNLSEPYSEELHTSFASDYSIQYAMRACDNAGNCSAIKTFTYDGSNGTFK